MGVVPLQVAVAVSTLKQRLVQKGVQAAAAALILFASLDVQGQVPIIGPTDAIGVDYPDASFFQQAIDRFEVQHDGGQWISVGIPPIYAAVDGITTYMVQPPTQAGYHTLSFRICNAGACSTSTNPFAFAVPDNGSPEVGAVPGNGSPEVGLGIQLRASHAENKCLDVSGSSTENGSPIIHWQCHGGANQLWSIEAVADGYTRLVSRHSGKCLDVSGGESMDGAALIQWECHGGANQQWRLEPIGDGFQLIARHSGKCLDVPGWSTDDGIRLVQWQCNGGPNQTWRARDR